MTTGIYDKLIDSQWHEQLMLSTEQVIKGEYSKYKPFYDFILDFIKKNKYLLSNLEFLLDQEIQLDKPLHIYVLDPNAVSNNLFKELCRKFGKLFTLRTELKEKHYSIDNVNKHYIRVSYIDQYKNVSLIDFLEPVNIHDYLALPPILELIDLYKNIYNPENVDEWADLIYKAQVIKKITNINIRNSISSNKGGGDVQGRAEMRSVVFPKKTEMRSGDKCTDCRDKKTMTLVMVKKIMLDFLREYHDYILVHNFVESENNNLAIISKNPIQTDFERINNYLTKQGGDFIVIFKKKNLFIGKDQRISKHTLFVSFAHSNEFANTQKPFIDIYNNMEYELIPYREHDRIRMAHAWVEIRFYYIEIWNLLAAYHLKIISYDKFAEYTILLLKTIDEMKIDWSVAPTEFMGIYINEYQAFKQLMFKEGTNTRLYC